MRGVPTSRPASCPRAVFGGYVVRVNYYVNDEHTCSEQVKCYAQLHQTLRALEKQHPQEHIEAALVGEELLSDNC